MTDAPDIESGEESPADADDVCLRCKGEGVVDDPGELGEEICPECDGSGRVSKGLGG